MDNWNPFKGKRAERQLEPATNPGPKPGDFPLGSLKSRAAARRALERWKTSAWMTQFILKLPRRPWDPSCEECPGGERQIVIVDDRLSEGMEPL